MARDEAGYTLTEVLVVIALFSVVMTLTASAFRRIVDSSAQTLKSSETMTGGLIGLEVLRIDLENTGMGLPWSFPTPPGYSEAASTTIQGVDPAFFNDAPNDPPRGVVSGNNIGLNGSDYLVLKGTAVGISRTSRKWLYLSYSSMKTQKSQYELIPGNDERVIVLKSGVKGEAFSRELVMNGSSFSLTFNLPLPSAFAPNNRTDTFLVYGVAPPVSSGSSDGTGTIRFPFNRADYFISRRDSISAICAPGTGVLYKGALQQSGGGISFAYPILDCVGDMQVMFSLDTDQDGQVDWHVSDINSDTLHLDAEQIREQVKEIKVYILAQEGKKDTAFNFPVTDADHAILVGDPEYPSLGRVWKQSDLATTFGPDWRHYRWKLYTIAVQPTNLAVPNDLK